MGRVCAGIGFVGEVEVEEDAPNRFVVLLWTLLPSPLDFDALGVVTKASVALVTWRDKG